MSDFSRTDAMTLTFKGKKYPAVETQFGIVATESLEEALLDEHGVPVDQEADDLDCMVYFFVPDGEMSEDVSSVEEYVRNNVV